MPTVKKTLDIENPPKPSQEDLTRFDAIEDRSIDYADIPELGDNFFRKAKKKEHHRALRCRHGAMVQSAG